MTTVQNDSNATGHGGGDQHPPLTSLNGASKRDAALAYARMGWKVLPLWWPTFSNSYMSCACRRTTCEKKGTQGKHPHDSVPRGLLQATTDVEQIRTWWQVAPDANVGVVMHASGLLALDRDGWKGGSRIEEWGIETGAYAHAESGSLDGDHYVWLSDQDTKPSKFMDGVDVRHDAYIVVAPSVHKSGNLYRWRSDQLPGPMPAEIRDRLWKPRVERPEGSDDWEPDDKVDRLALMRGDASAYGSQRDALIALFCSHWAQGKLDKSEILDLLRLAVTRMGNTRPEQPWTDDDLKKLADDLATKKQRGVSFETTELEPWMLQVFKKPDMTDGLRQAVQREFNRREAVRICEERDAVEARGERPKRSLTAYELVVQPRAVLENRLAPEVNLLGGPRASGKSLLARDWSFEVARSGRNVLYVASEGMFDFAERWTSQPGYADVRDRIFVLDPVRITSEIEVDWLLNEYRDERPALVVFDLIYDMGDFDENSAHEVGQVFRGCKRISVEWGGGTLLVGHSKNPRDDGSVEPRFRGSASWSQRAYTDWFMYRGVLTCEKSKIADAYSLTRRYRLTYPTIEWLDGVGAVISSAADQQRALEDRIVELVTKLGATSKNIIQKNIGGNRQAIFDTIDLLLAEDQPRIIKDARARIMPASPEPVPEPVPEVVPKN